MYNLVNSLLGIPTGTGVSVNSTVSYVAGAIVIILVIVFIDLFYRLIRMICNRGRFD